MSYHINGPSALRLAFSLVGTPPSGESREALRRKVTAFVDDLRAEGCPPERAILAVKRLANDAGLSTTSGIVYGSGAATGPDALMMDLINWCMERYGLLPSQRGASRSAILGSTSPAHANGGTRLPKPFGARS